MNKPALHQRYDLALAAVIVALLLLATLLLTGSAQSAGGYLEVRDAPRPASASGRGATLTAWPTSPSTTSSKPAVAIWPSPTITSAWQQEIDGSCDKVFVKASHDQSAKGGSYLLICGKRAEEPKAPDALSRPLDVPPTPSVISPPNGGVLNTLIPLLQIDAGVSGVEVSPQILWSQDPTFSSWDGYVIFCGWTGRQFEFELDYNLIPATQYYWRARSAYGDACGNANAEWGSWSEVWTFTTGSGGTILPGPELVSPLDGSTVSVLRPTLEWRFVPGALGFKTVGRKIEDSGTGFGWGAYNWYNAPTSFQVYRDLEPNETYEWWVQFRNDYAWGEESSHWRFRILPGPDTPPPTPQPGQPVMQQVQPCFTGAYWPSGAYVNNRFTAHVDWQGTTPSRVDFTLNDVTSQETPSPGTAAHAYNMGADLQYDLLGARNTLRVAAYPQSGSPSDPHTQALIGYGLPRWLPQGTLFQAVFYADCPESPLRFRSEWLWEFPMHGQVTPPGWFPFIGGQSFGLRKPKVRFRKDVSTDGSGRLEGGGEGGVAVAGQTVFGRLTLGGEGRVTEDQGLQITAADFGGEIGGRLKKKWPVLDAICDAFTSGVCPLQEAEGLPLVGRLVRWFNERVKLEAQIEPAARLKTKFHTTSDDWVWDWLDAGGRIKTTIGLSAKVIEGLAASAYGGGEPDFSLKLLPDPGLDRVTARLFAGLKLRAFRWEGIYEAGYEWRYPETQLLAADRAVQRWARATPWRPIPRDYAKDPAAYAVFRANVPVARVLKPSAAQVTTEILIATNVYPHSEPALAADTSTGLSTGGTTLLLWVHDDVSKPLMQGEEIYYSLYDGASWSTPAGITDDNLQDFAPQVVFDGSGQTVAVWERNKVLQSASSELNAAYVNAFEIAYAVWDGTAWSIPAYLTDNEAFDHAPVLARGGHGKLLLVWRQNADGEMLGMAGSPDTLYAAFWDGSAWTVPQVILSDVTGLLGLSAAYYDDSHATLVYARDTDGDLATTTDQELFALTWDGVTWSDPTQLTDDGEPDTSPTVLYDAAGDVRLLWLKGETLYALFGSLSGTGQPVVVQGSTAILDYATTIDASGNLVLLWQGLSPEGADVFYATYDAARQVFSLEQQLTHDRSMEKSLAPAFAPTGELLMAYGEDELITTTVAVSPTLVISNVTTFGQSDLYVLRHGLGPDLALSATDIVLSTPNPAPGSTVTITGALHNQGDLAVADPQVAFYLSDPDAGGTQIGPLQTAPITLAGGMTTTLSVTWTVPAGGPFALYAVADPAETVAEQDETNNKAYITTVAPDLTVQDLAVGYGAGQGITLTATVSNTGVADSGAFTVAFRLNDPVTGTLLADTTMASIGPGTQVQTSASWDASAASDGWHKIYAIADAGNAILEADETNNSGWTSLGVLPDLAVYPTNIVTGTNELGGTVVSVWVHNEGLRNADGVNVGLYASFPVSSTVPLTQTVVSVPVGEVRVANLSLDRKMSGFYVGVNTDGVVVERDTGNNVAQLGRPCLLDFDGNGTVGAADVQAVASRWRQAVGPSYDLDGDGRVTIMDIMRVAAAWGNTCP